MRICLVSQEYPPGYVGGIGTQCQVKARGLVALGHEVEVLTAAAGDGGEQRSWVDQGATVHEVCSPCESFDVYRSETYWLGYTWSVLGALRALSAARPFDVIEFPDYAAEGFAFQLDRQDDDATAVVVHLHGSLAVLSERIGWPHASERLYRVGTFMEDLSIEGADWLLAASHSIAELIARRTGVSRELIDVVQGAVDAEMFSPADSPRLRDGETRLLFVGNVVANKGVLTVLDAFVRLSSLHPELVLLIAGSGDDDVEVELGERALQAGVADRVRQLGFVEHDELPQLYRSADLVAAPSQYEGGLGMVYLEAMGCGLPVVAAAAGGASEAIVDGATGFLLRHGDVEEVTAALELLLRDAELRVRMGAAGREHVQRRFTVEHYSARVAECYERAIERRRASLVAW